MTTIALVEIISAVFLGIILLRLNSEREESKDNKYLKISLLLCIFALLIDAAAYTIKGPEYPVALRYVINFFAFEAGAINIFGFTLYVRSFITKRGELNPWIFNSVLLVEIIWFLAVAFEFISGQFITYENGIESINYSIPLYLQVLSIAVIIYLSIAVLRNIKKTGTDIALLFCAFNLAPVTGVLISNYLEYDFTYVFSAIALAFTSEFIQKKQLQEHAKQQQALSDGLAREYHTVWLIDGFGSHNLHLYRSTGKATVQSAVQPGLTQPCYDTSVVQYVKDNVPEEDRERVIEETKFETIERETPETGTYVVTYRRYTADRSGYTYHQMCFARAAGTDGRTNYILAYRDADNMMKEQLSQQKQLEEALSRANKETVRRNMIYQISDSSQWSYEISAEDWVLSVNYSDKLLASIKSRPSDDPMGWVHIVHPEDKDRVLSGFMAAIRDHSGNTLYDETYRIMDTTGNYRRVRSCGRVVRQPDGSGEFIGISRRNSPLSGMTSRLTSKEKEPFLLKTMNSTERLHRKFCPVKALLSRPRLTGKWP